MHNLISLEGGQALWTIGLAHPSMGHYCAMRLMLLAGCAPHINPIYSYSQENLYFVLLLAYINECEGISDFFSRGQDAK